MSTTIKCPNCGNEFEPNDAIRDEVQKELRQKMVEWQSQKQREFEAEKTKIQKETEETLRKHIASDFENKLRLLERLIDEDGKPMGVMSSAIDVTESVRARKKAEESEKELITLANAMPQLVWIAQPNGEVIFYNDRVNEFLGAEKLSDGSWSWKGLLYADDLAGTADAWRQVLAQ